ncbi:hypothetical protein QUF86_10395 [Peribacillus sp. NJ11]|uniref:hypothetical protein n=1 Tax=Peribacillus sp. NJ11 TaxID=3055861 RepID=UPI0025A21786|nr:hypothetical protein [Peribacillus sp. NJ11]MDM5221126.1 hypothetical protein [Peribacillus sp. NJ11]
MSCTKKYELISRTQLNGLGTEISKKKAVFQTHGEKEAAKRGSLKFYLGANKNSTQWNLHIFA